VPLYEYVCANGHRTEVMHGIHATGPAACPVCGASTRKAFVAPTIVFKGSGWAKVDRRSSAGGSRSKERDAASTGDGTGSDQESKPASRDPAPAPADTGAGSGSGSGSDSGAGGESSTSTTEAGT
jgi:putative FmdB family regulatory protein